MLPSPPLSQDNFGLELAAVEAAVRKHEAIETDIVAYSGRVQAVDAVAAELAAEHYHDIKRIAARQNNVARLWDFLREMVAARRERLLLNLELQKVFQDLLYLMDWMAEMKVAVADSAGQGPGVWLSTSLTHSAPPHSVHYCPYGTPSLRDKGSDKNNHIAGTSKAGGWARPF